MFQSLYLWKLDAFFVVQCSLALASKYCHRCTFTENIVRMIGILTQGNFSKVLGFKNCNKSGIFCAWKHTWGRHKILWQINNTSGSTFGKFIISSPEIFSPHNWDAEIVMHECRLMDTPRQKNSSIMAVRRWYSVRVHFFTLCISLRPNDCVRRQRERECCTQTDWERSVFINNRGRLDKPQSKIFVRSGWIRNLNINNETRAIHSSVHDSHTPHNSFDC